MIENLGYSPKDIKFGELGREKLINGITKIAGAVKSTLGPRGNTVLIESANHTAGITVTKDGVTVAKAVDLIDPVENLAVRMMKEAADKTATNAGDGTTTAIVLTEALVLHGDNIITPELNRIQVLRHMVEIADDVVENLKKKKKKVTKKMVSDVATISANNDKTIGGIISRVYNEIGTNGIVTVEKSQTSETYAESTHGFKVQRGYYSPYFINDHKRDECVLEDTMVLVCDAEIHNILQLENILKPIIQEGKRLLIIAPCSAPVVNTLAANVAKGNLKLCAIEPPSFGYKKHELMADIALAVGAKYFSEKTGDDLSLMTYADLGHAAKIIVDSQNTVIINSDARTDEEAVAERVSQLWASHAEATKKHDKDFILSRIASLTGGVGVIFVGGTTDIEQKELYDRVDDAVCAVRSALEEGVLPGGGKALLEESIVLENIVGKTAEYNAALSIIRSALKVPSIQILSNAGLYFDDIYKFGDGYLAPGQGYNVKTGEYGDLLQMGVIDPFKVTRSALQNAISVATTILSTDAIITMARTYDAR
jgi:chaperonin GroEL